MKPWGTPTAEATTGSAILTRELLSVDKKQLEEK